MKYGGGGMVDKLDMIFGSSRPVSISICRIFILEWNNFKEGATENEKYSRAIFALARENKETNKTVETLSFSLVTPFMNPTKVV